MPTKYIHTYRTEDNVRILITGGAGFHGSHITEKWVTDGHDVTILNTYSDEAAKNISSYTPDVRVVWGSVTDEEIVEKTSRSQEVIVHLAAHINVDESLSIPHRFLDVNIGGTLNILEVVRRTGARLIFASSCEAYGHAVESPVKESAELRPYSPYAASKAAADRMCFAYSNSFGVDVTIVRPSNVYGERQKSGRDGAVIPIFTNLAKAGKSLKVFGTGQQRREYTHVTDIVQAYDLILRRDDLSGLAVNVGSGQTPSIVEIASFIAERTGVDVTHEPPRPGEVPGFHLDSSLIRSYGYEPKVEFWDGLSCYLDLTSS